MPAPSMPAPFEFPPDFPKIGQTIRYMTKRTNARHDFFDTTEATVAARGFDGLEEAPLLTTSVGDELFLYSEDQALGHGLEAGGWYDDINDPIYHLEILK